MTRKRKKNVDKDDIGIRGFFRIKIGEKDENGNLRIVGGSGWDRNTFTSVAGVGNAILDVWAADAGSQLAQSMVLGTQTNSITTAQASLSGQGGAADAAADYKAVTKTTTVSSASGTFEMSATFDGSDFAADVGAVGVVSASNGSILAGNTFSGGSSSFSNGQTASVTYEWRVTT